MCRRLQWDQVALEALPHHEALAHLAALAAHQDLVHPVDQRGLEDLERHQHPAGQQAPADRLALARLVGLVGQGFAQSW